MLRWLTKKTSLIVLFLISLLLTTSGSADFYIRSNEVIGYENTSDNMVNTDTVKVDIVSFLSETATNTDVQVGGVTNVTNETTWNTFESIAKTYFGLSSIFEEGGIFSSDTYTYSEGQYTAQNIQSTSNLPSGFTIGDNIVLQINSSIVKTDRSIFSDEYEGSYVLYKRTTIYSYNPVDTIDGVIASFAIPKGSKFQISVVEQNINYDRNKYSISHFVIADDNNNNTEERFDLNTVINEDIKLCLILNDKASGKFSDITNKINSTTSGTLKVYSTNPDQTLNVANDASYTSFDKSFVIGNSNTETTINSGVTVNFCLNNGEIRTMNKTIELDYSTSDVEPLNPVRNKHNLQYKIVLQNDLNINGTMTIASRYGTYRNNHQEGTITDDYVWLDLNGYDINIGPNGLLENYGLITDSVGTGTINVDGGQVTTMMVVHDYKGGSATSASASSKIFPFVMYLIPYLRCRVRFYYNNQWGRLLGVCNLKVSNTPDVVTDASISFLGNYSQNSNDYFFGLEAPSQSDSYVELNTTKNNNYENDLGSDIYNTTDYRQAINYRNQWTFKNIVFHLMPIKIDLGKLLGVLPITVDLGEFDFPISPFFDIKVYNCDLYFKQSISLLPGSSFYLDKDCRLIFEYEGSDLVASLSILEKPPFYYSEDKTSFLLYGCIFATSNSYYGNELWSSKYFQKYYGEAICYNEGSTLFKTGNSAEYKLFGKYNFNKIGYYSDNIDNAIYIDTENINTSIFQQLETNGANINTVGFNYIPYNADEERNLKIYALPLISHGLAYAEYNGSYIQGTWDNTNYVINYNNQHYFVYFNAAVSFSDKSCSLAQVGEMLTNKTISYNGTNYILFAGVYVPINANNQITITRWYDTSNVGVRYDTTYQYWRR